MRLSHLLISSKSNFDEFFFHEKDENMLVCFEFQSIYHIEYCEKREVNMEYLIILRG